MGIQNRLAIRTRRVPGDGKAPSSPTFGMEWWSPSSGETQVYRPPGQWEVVSGGSAKWNSITGKPLTYPPAPHSHTLSAITDLPIGTWVIPPISDANTNAAIRNLETLLKNAGIIS